MSGPTPGPWRLCHGDDECVVAPDGKTVVAECDSIVGDPPADSYEREANAHLIAAAPDLLGTLRELLERTGVDADSDPDVGCNCIQCRARAAIAKAEGRP